jgi:aryl-alcohol dehydrogenase-like predicted oxidoreductase/murein tripeptide amidase MpaA
VVDARFDRYYRYADLVAILQAYAEEYPRLVQIESIGKSYEGRDVWLAKLSNQATGDDLAKPALWVDGNIHASEVSPSSVCLYLIDWLLKGYGTNPEITRCLDTRVFYVCPRVNPDGAEWALADVPRIVRSSTRPYPYDEDPIGGLVEQDVDGDGRILLMRVPDPNGAWKVCPESSRLLIRRDPTETGGTYYRVLPEGQIEDFDGVTIQVQPKKERLDLNRNFPTNWRPESQQRGAGPYPLSEPETRALAQFVGGHPNITGAVAFHTYSGVLLRPYSHASDDTFPPEDRWTYQKIGEKGTQLTGYPAISIFHDFRYNPKDVISGGLDEWFYEHVGVFFWGVELWSPQRQAGITEYKYIDWNREHPLDDDLKLLRWSDEVLGGKGYVDWYAYDHPQLGPVELGGWDQLYAFRNPPPQFLEREIAPFAEWLLWHLLISPKLELFEASATPLGGGDFLVRLVVQNTGWLPTYVTKLAVERKVVRGVVAEIELPDGATLGSGRRREELGQLEGRAYKPSAPASGFSGNVDVTDDRSKVEWLVRAPAGGAVRLIARHERAGVARTELALETELALDVSVPATVQARPVSERERRPLFARLSHSRAALPRRKLGRTDLLVTEIALGGVGLGGRRTTNDDAIAAATVRRAWERGINYLDTSPLYAESERRIGLAFQRLNGRPRGLYLSTKTGTHPLHRGDYSAEGTRWSVENSLRFLGVDSVDLLLVHDPESMDPVLAPGGAVDELERLRDEGKLRWIGLGVREHDKLSTAIRSGRFDAILTYADYNLVRQSATPLIAEAAAQGVGVILAQVFLAGLLVGPDPAQSLNASHPDAPLARDWWLWARERGVSLRSLALQFGLRNPHVGTVLTGADSPAQVDEIVDAVSVEIPDAIWGEVAERIARQQG